MNRPLPIFRLVFAAYYATSNQSEFDDEAAFWRARRLSKSEFPVLVIDNDADPSLRTRLRSREILRERQID